MLIPDLLVMKMTSISKAVFPQASFVLSIWSCFLVGETCLGDKLLQETEVGFQVSNNFGYLEKEAHGMLGSSNRSSILGHLVAQSRVMAHYLNQELSHVGSP